MTADRRSQRPPRRDRAGSAEPDTRSADGGVAPAACAACAEPVPARARFCPRCGAPTAPRERHAPAEPAPVDDAAPAAAPASALACDCDLCGARSGTRRLSAAALRARIAAASRDPDPPAATRPARPARPARPPGLARPPLPTRRPLPPRLAEAALECVLPWNLCAACEAALGAPPPRASDRLPGSRVTVVAATALALVIAGAGVVAALAARPRPPDAVPVTLNLADTRLAVIPAEVDRWWAVAFSPTGRRVAVEALRRGGGRLIFTGEAGASPRTHERVSPPIFSADGRLLAYSVKRGDGHHAVVDGALGPAFDDVASMSPHPGGERVAYRARRVDGERAWWSIVVDGREGPPYDWVGTPVWSPDGSALAHTAGRGAEAFVVLDGRPGPSFEVVSDPIFSPDGRRVAYAGAARGGPSTVVFGDERLGPFEHFPTDLAVSPDGRALAFRVRVSWTHEDGWSERIVAAGEAQPVFRRTGPPAWSPDSRRIAYWASTTPSNRPAHGAWTVVGAPSRVPVHDDLFDDAMRRDRPTWSPDGRSLAYRIQPGFREAFVVIDGHSGERFAGVAAPVARPDGRGFVYAAQRLDAKVVVVAGARRSEPFDWDWDDDPSRQPVLSFSPDGRKVCYGALLGRELWWKVMELD